MTATAAAVVASGYAARYTTEQMTTLDRLVRSSESLLARKQTFYAAQKRVLFATVFEVWRQPQQKEEAEADAWVREEVWTHRGEIRAHGWLLRARRRGARTVRPERPAFARAVRRVHGLPGVV